MTNFEDILRSNSSASCPNHYQFVQESGTKIAMMRDRLNSLEEQVRANPWNSAQLWYLFDDVDIASYISTKCWYESIFRIIDL